MFMLRNRAPERFAAGGGARALNAIGQMELTRLKRQLREQWERERWARDAEQQEEAIESVDRFLENMARNRRGNMSPAQREREIAAKAQERADKAAGWGPGLAYGEFAAA